MSHEYVSIYAEHQYTVSSLSLSVSLNKQDTSSNRNICVVPEYMRIEVDADSKLLLYTSKKEPLCSIQFPGIRIRPKLCHSLRWQHAEGIQFTLKTHKPGTSILRVDNTQKKVTLAQSIMDMLSDNLTTVDCVWCDHELFNVKQKFAKVSNLPSENWAELADMWFCHPKENGCHGQKKKGQKKRHQPEKHPLLPARKDCLVGSTMLWLNPDYLNTFNSTEVEDTTREVKCKECKQTIGNILNIDQTSNNNDGNVAKVDLTALRIRNPDQHSIPKTLRDSFASLEYLLSAMMLEYLDEQTFRLLITAKQLNTKRPKPILQIWIMGDSTNIYSTTIPTTKVLPVSNGETTTTTQTAPKTISKSAQKRRNRRNRNKQQQPKPKEDTDNSISDKNSESNDSINTDNVLEPYSVIKVLYTDCYRDQTVKDWYKESNQEIITLPEQICLQLLSLLVQSTKMIPVSQRRNRQFYIGHLRVLEREYVPVEVKTGPRRKWEM